ncbi:MAG: patatin-like phospholipase family protein [Proteobacteria bacterium]|nr:patatin-like phospholipase family protein [Pseudomonadota bacterium]
MQLGITDLSTNTIAEFLAATPFFQNIKSTLLKELASQFSPLLLSGGELLIQQGEPGDSLYLIIQGRLRVFREHDGTFEVLSEAGRGDLIGELALLTEEKRAATVCALRDSAVLKLNKKDFDKFVLDNPLALMQIAKYSIKRLLQPSMKDKVKLKTIALVPSGSFSNITSFTRIFTDNLSQNGSVLMLDSAFFDTLFTQYQKAELHPAQASFDSSISTSIASFLSDLEEKYDFIVYLTDNSLSPWTRRCIRQADRVLLVASEIENKALNSVEDYIFAKSALFSVQIDLAILHRDKTSMPIDTSGWLAKRKVSSYHHLSYQRKETFSRLTRFLLQKNFALVFGGGGARGLAHIGVYKALCELKIPVDIVGGSSAGAMIAAFIAMEYDWQNIRDIMYEFSVKNIKKLFDLTFPIVSIFRARAWSTSLIKAYGDELRIEDLWRRFFCVATNISEHNLAILQQGLVWKAVRSSISLPGIVPPLSMADQKLFVDGAVINNLPVDIMRQFSNEGRIIAVNVSSVQSLQSNDFPDGSLSGWGLLFQKLNPLTKKRRPHVPSMAEIILQSIFLGGHQHAKKELAMADFYIDLAIDDIAPLDFKSIDVLIERGYQLTMKKCADLKNLDFPKTLK